MSTPATPEVTPGPDDQTALVRPDHDPNLNRSGIYKFEIDAGELKKGLQAVVLPKRRAPFLTIEVSTSILTCRAQTNDASFVIAASAPLLQPAEIGFPIRFEVDRNVMMNTIPHFNGPLAFTFHRFSSSLAWVAHEGDSDYRIDARWLPPAAPEAGLRQLAVISREVGRGIRYAATLIGRKEPPNFPYDGVVVDGGSILGGYYCGASRYRSPLLPENLRLSVPKDHVANALALCHRLAGPVEVLETDARIYLKAVNIEGSWNRVNQSAADLNRTFETCRPRQTVMVSTEQLQMNAYFMAGLFERLQVTVEDRGASPSAYYRARVVFTGSGPIGRSMGSGKTPLDGVFVSNGDSQRPADHAEVPPPWDLTINAKDLRDAVGAVRTVSIRLSHLANRGGQGLLIQAEDGEAEYATILLGFERQ